MKLVRARHRDRTVLARVDGELATVLATESAHIAADVLRESLAEGLDLAGGGEQVAATDLSLLAPVANPQKVIAIGLNYADHARESGMEPPAAPVSFVKTTNSIIGPDEPIVFRAGDSTEVDYEVELAAVIGRRARDVSVARALEHVLGYTVCNDVSARDAQFADGQWVRGKSFDTFCPLGPAIVTTEEIADVQDLVVRCTLNGTVLQDSTTREMIFGVAELVAYLSRFMTLEPGDVIATGTPFGVGFARTPPVYLADGDLVECEVEGVGVLTNPVRVK